MAIHYLARGEHRVGEGVRAGVYGYIDGFTGRLRAYEAFCGRGTREAKEMLWSRCCRTEGHDCSLTSLLKRMPTTYPMFPNPHLLLLHGYFPKKGVPHPENGNRILKGTLHPSISETPPAT